MHKLIDIADMAMDDEVPPEEKLKLIPKIHDVTSSLKAELPNMSNNEKVDLVIRITILQKIVNKTVYDVKGRLRK
jgi:hypothetical protein